jgi:hypothetical protein
VVLLPKDTEVIEVIAVPLNVAPEGDPPWVVMA